MAVKLNEYTIHRSTRPVEYLSKVDSNQSWMNKDIQLFNRNLGVKQKKQLYEELAALLTAGLDIQKALLLIEKSQRKLQHKNIIFTIKEQIVNGASLSDALNLAGGFSTYETTCIQIGEESGRITTVLKELSLFFTKTLKYRQQLIGALSYPLFVTSFALAVVFFLLKYLVPMFSGIYDRFDSELPIITQKIIAMSNWLGKYSLVIALGTAIVIAMMYIWRKKDWLRKLSAAIALRLPLFGSIVHQIYLSRFCQSMSLLLGAKVSLLKAVELVKKMSDFYPLETSLGQVEIDILHGKSIHEALSAFPFYPPQLIALLRVGEETGKIEEMFDNLANQYNDSVDARTALIGSLLEPVLIIGLGVLVGIILIAMYLPLFQMSTSIG